jgi:hypothetical protein
VIFVDVSYRGNDTQWAHVGGICLLYGERSRGVGNETHYLLLSRASVYVANGRWPGPDVSFLSSSTLVWGLESGEVLHRWWIC